jgi:ankyrin repeat protein
VFRGKTWIGMVLAALAGAMLLAGPAQAQFSDGYKFLEAVKKKDGGKVTELLNEPGSTVINARDLVTGQSALHLVTARRDDVWIRFLVAKGANPNTRDKKGVTPLVIASQLGFIEGVQALIEAGARVDEANDAGETPLMSAVHRRDITMMRILLKAGADPERSDNSGRSARDYAALDDSTLVAEIDKNAKPKAQRAGAAVYGPTF